MKGLWTPPVAPPPDAWAPRGWYQEAACRGMDVALFYPGKGEPIAPAKAVCGQCPVRAECAEAGKHERYGVWGGTAVGKTSSRTRRLREAAA